MHDPCRYDVTCDALDGLFESLPKPKTGGAPGARSTSASAASSLAAWAAEGAAAVWTTVAAVMHLGNVAFQAGPATEDVHRCPQKTTQLARPRWPTNRLPRTGGEGPWVLPCAGAQTNSRTAEQTSRRADEQTNRRIDEAALQRPHRSSRHAGDLGRQGGRDCCARYGGGPQRRDVAVAGGRVAAAAGDAAQDDHRRYRAVRAREVCDAPHATHRTPRTHPLHDALAAQIASPIPLYLFSGTTTLSETWERVPRLLHARSAYACAS